MLYRQLLVYARVNDEQVLGFSIHFRVGGAQEFS